MPFGYLVFILAGIFVVLVLVEVIGALIDGAHRNRH